MNEMVDAQQREFKLSLTIADDTVFDGAHATLALVRDPTGSGTPVLMINAGGFPGNEEGAGELADMLRDAADAIDDHLGNPRPHIDTASLPVAEMRRPRFNPKPRGVSS